MRITGSLPKKLTIVVCVVILLLIPLLVRSGYVMDVLILCFIYGILSVSWDLLAGFAGQLSLGTAAFFAIGAYGSAIISMPPYNLSPWFGMIVGGLLAAVIGLVLFLPSLRLRGVYFALASLGFAEIVSTIVYAANVTAGATGIWGYPTFNFPIIGTPIPILSPEPYYYLYFTMLLVSAFLSYKVVKSKTGLCFKSIREDELLARVMGMNTTYYKAVAFFISSFLAGIAGGLFAYYVMVVTPSTAAATVSVTAMVMAIVGGKGTIIGPIIGAFTIQIMLEAFLFVGPQYNYVFLGLLLIVFMLFLPNGIIGLLRKYLSSVRR